MYPVEQSEFPEEFERACAAAARHLDRLGQGALHWLRSDLHPPVAEHLSFRLGNRLFFVFVEVPGMYEFDPDLNGIFLRVAREATAIPCLLAMQPTPAGYAVREPGWGLREACTGDPVAPPDLVSDERIEISDWEVHDLGIAVVRKHIEREGKTLGRWQSYPGIDPSLWFGDGDDLYWVVVRTVRYPALRAMRPDDLATFEASLRNVAAGGYFASVSLASTGDAFDPDVPPTPLYRGHAVHVRYEGLEPLRTE